ncbi:MAG: glycosyltransferase family 4 protein [Bacteroidales bacterium]|nr:glycosyltransferase family 4 protein [Bacteroidales bacterium]
MRNILLLTLLTGNGGIASWSRKFVKTFCYVNYHIFPVDRVVKGRKFEENSLKSRLVAGYFELKKIRKEVKKTIVNENIDILHTTTSGSIGTFRDYVIAKICKKYHIKSIMHCHYGCISEDLERPAVGWFLKKTMCLYDQIWVLDRRSEKKLKSYSPLANKVFLTPNSIQALSDVVIYPSEYKKIAFIGNLIPSKGLMELVEAICEIDEKVCLYIVGDGDEEVISKIKSLAGQNIGKRIFLKGRLSNEDAIRFMQSVDILALPTYYPWEAFPISILEAMSLGKLVLSTNRAAIGDMLTNSDGQRCGLIVREKSVDDIVEKIKWVLNHKKEADQIRRLGYEKVYREYRTDVVYTLYKNLYEKLFD